MNKITRTRFLRQLCALPLMLGTALAASAQQWPERPIRIVVPYPAGGLTDTVSRSLVDELSKHLGQPVVVENRGGAGGQVGLQAVLAAPRDGYTVGLVVPATMITLPLTNPNYKIEPLKDFEPITAAVETSLILVVNKDMGINSLAQFTEHAKKNPGKLNYGLPGLGTSFHFSNVRMNNALGIQTTPVPYQGEAPVFNDLAAGQLQYALLSSTMRAQIAESGRVVPLAVTGAKRINYLPNVGTFAEQGVNFSSDGWVGFVVGAGTPQPVINRLHEAFVAALRAPAVAERFTNLGMQVVANTPAQFKASIEQGTRTYGEMVRSGAVKLD